MKLLKAFFSLRFLINAIIGIALLVGLFFGFRYYLNIYTQHDQEIKVPDISKMKLFDAIVALDNAGLKYEVDSFKFNDKYKPYSLFDIYPAVGADVKIGRRIFLRANPKTWAPVTIPNIKDRSKNIAFVFLENTGLIMGDTIYEPHKYADVVLRMMYKNKVIHAGEEVPRFSKIDLVIGKALDKDVPMINILGLNLKDAERTLKQNYFELGRVTFEGFKDSANARVFYQFPLAGDIYDQGDNVDIWVTDKQSDSLLTNRINELNAIYNPKIRTDSAGNVNYNFQTEISGNVSREVRRQIETGVVEGTNRQTTTPTQPAAKPSKPKRNTTQNNTPSTPQRDPNEGVIVE